MKHIFLQRYFLIGFISLIFLIVGWIVFKKYSPSSHSLLANISFSQTVYDQQGRLLRLTLSKDQKYRVYTPIEQISPLLIEATLLQEDRYFYWHPGINPIALIKAGWSTYVQQSRMIGASTITMQVARLRYHLNSRTLLGKLTQILYALRLELFYSKAEILEAYLNLASYGGNIEGVGAASLIYFSKPAKQLTLPEALTLSVIPQNPLRRKPDKTNVLALTTARARLFQTWLQIHPQDITEKNLLSLPWSLHKTLPFTAPHFVNYLLRQHPTEPSIHSTLDYQLQKLVEQISQHYLINQNQYGIHNIAIMLVDARDMQVKALLGSGNFFATDIDGQVDGAHAKRSPGSTLKPFIYALALDQGLIHPYTILKDAPTRFATYTPDNFDKDFLGPIRAKDALALSRNVPAIILADQLQHPNLYQLLQQAKITRLKPESNYGLSLVLGGAEVTMAELVSLYAMLANGGIWQPLRYEQNLPISLPIRLLSPEASFLTLDMLHDTPRPFPMNSAIHQAINVAWKTGTSSGYRDAWSVGVVGPYVLAVWIGNFNGKANPAFVGAKSAAPLFFAIVDALAQQIPLPDKQPPLNQLHLVRVKVCAGSGMLPTRWCPQLVSTWFIPGKSPIKKDTIYREIAIDNKTGLRACQFDQNVHFAVYEFWPSDLLKIFAQAGIARQTPPPFAKACSALDNVSTFPPQIVSPQSDVVYSIRDSQTEEASIVLQATTAADVKKLYWFVNNSLLGQVEPDKTLSWQAKPGRYQVRVVDDHGQSDVVGVMVQLLK